MIKADAKKIAVFSSLIAGLIWGGWAFHINRAYGNSLDSAAIQFFCSAFSTATMSFVIIYIRGMYDSENLKLIMPPFVTVLLVASLLLSLHSLSGTENIIKTILPPCFVGFIYSCFFSFSLSKVQKIEH